MLSQLLNAALLAALSGGTIAARVLLHGETINERTSLLITTAALSGAIAGLFLTPLCEGRHSWLARWRAAAGFVWVFMGAMLFLYVVHYEFLASQVDRLPGDRAILPLRSMLRTSATFLALSPSYLLPWPLPLMAVMAGALLPGWARRKG